MLLVIGYFVCGFHVAFVGGHLPAYISDKGIGLSLFGIELSPVELGGWAIGMVGLFNIAGAIMWSSMGAPVTSARTFWRCSTCCARWCSWASWWRRCRRPRC